MFLRLFSLFPIHSGKLQILWFLNVQIDSFRYFFFFFYTNGRKIFLAVKTKKKYFSEKRRGRVKIAQPLILIKIFFDLLKFKILLF